MITGDQFKNEGLKRVTSLYEPTNRMIISELHCLGVIFLFPLFLVSPGISPQYQNVYASLLNKAVCKVIDILFSYLILEIKVLHNSS